MTWHQVWVGAAVGLIAGSGWYAAYERVIAPRCPAIAEWEVCRWLCLKDLSQIGNALEFERDNALAHARAASRRSGPRGGTKAH